MEETTFVILVALAAFFGGICNAILGWTRKIPPEPWCWRQFIASAIAALIGAAIIAVGFDFSGITKPIFAIIGAFIAGAGVTSGTSNVSGSISARVINKMAELKKNNPTE